MKTISIVVLLIWCSLPSLQAQIRINEPGQVVERNIEYRANSKIDQEINKGLDKVEAGIISIFKKKEKTKPAPTTSPTDRSDATSNSSANRMEGSPMNSAPSLKSYSKFDFIPGEKVIALEDFMQDAIGDFPDKWNSTGSGEIVTLSGKTGHWLMLNKQGEYLPEFIKNLPENFTLQFDLACNETFNYYSSYFWLSVVNMANPAKDFTKWGRFPTPMEGARVGLHPRNAAISDGTGMTELITYSKGNVLLKNETDQQAFTNSTHNVVKVSMWRQKQRFRVYVDETKVWDVPRAFQPGVTYNGIVLAMTNMHKEDDRYYISNFRLAVGAPDTRNKLITEGKFVTRGILFDPNSDKIKSESYGALKDIANVLTENADVNVRIIGHTDSDGDDASNMVLSKKRAVAVKAELSNSFGIDTRRMETDGKGESQPVGSNTSAEGKANNRRVEFVKL